MKKDDVKCDVKQYGTFVIACLKINHLQLALNILMSIERYPEIYLK